MFGLKVGADGTTPEGHNVDVTGTGKRNDRLRWTTRFGGAEPSSGD